MSAALHGRHHDELLLAFGPPHGTTHKTAVRSVGRRHVRHHGETMSARSNWRWTRTGIFWVRVKIVAAMGAYRHLPRPPTNNPARWPVLIVPAVHVAITGIHQHRTDQSLSRCGAPKPLSRRAHHRYGGAGVEHGSGVSATGVGPDVGPTANFPRLATWNRRSTP